jgi:sugar/nucleoside kinase (ribokinase family)
MTIVVVGDAAMDVLARHHHPVTPGTDQPADTRAAIGGAGANLCAWLAGLGADAALVGRVGDDPAGRIVTAELSAAGVECALTVDPAAGTCWVVVLVDGQGQRAMLSDRGAARRLRPTDLSAELLARARHLHVSGYVLLDPASRAAGTAMLATARAAGLSTSVDPQGGVPITDPAGFRELVRGVDLLLPNAAELATLTGSAEPGSAVELLGVVGAVAVTMGAAGACWIDRDGVLAEPARRVECVDSTGAGDAFDAALLHARLSGAPPREALRAGVAAGTAAVGFVGAQPIRRR